MLFVVVERTFTQGDAEASPTPPIMAGGAGCCYWSCELDNTNTRMPASRDPGPCPCLDHGHHHHRDRGTLERQ